MSADITAQDQERAGDDPPGRPFTMVVERGKIREFARATKTDDPAYVTGDVPLSPPTFLMTAAFWQGREHLAPGLPTDLRRILHGEQEFRFFGEPPRAGAELTGEQRVERVWKKEGRRGGAMTFYEVVTAFRDAEGTVVAESRATLIETGRPPKEGQA